MKMRLTGFLAFVLLSLSILSYGTSGAVFADTHNVPPVSVSVDSAFYNNGDSAQVTGKIKGYDSTDGKGLTFTIKSPTDSIVRVGQPTPSSDGTFTTNVVVGGDKWKANGDYTIQFNYGANSGETIINYVGGEPSTITPEPEPEPTPTPEPPVVTPVSPPEPPVVVPPPPTEEPTCGAGTQLVNGICQVVQTEAPKGGGCLIATAAYGSELAPQVQFLREIRDNTVMSTASGISFMSGFNQLYYSFSPTIADMERANPMFQQLVRAFITPMISTLSIMTLADDGSESQVLGLGLSVIALNLGMYIAAPAFIGFKVHNRIKSRK